MRFEVLYVGRGHEIQESSSVRLLQPGDLSPAKRVYLGDTPRQEGHAFIVPLVGTTADVSVIVIAARADQYSGQEPIDQLYESAKAGQIPFAVAKSVVGNFRLTTPSLEQGEYHLFVAVFADDNQ